MVQFGSNLQSRRSDVSYSHERLLTRYSFRKLSQTAYRDRYAGTAEIEGLIMQEQSKSLRSEWFETKLGPMIAIADDQELYLLEFENRRGLAHEMEILCKRTQSDVTPGRTNPIVSIEAEVEDYFAGNLKSFKTPIHIFGTPFQREVWQALMNIPYGETRSYQDQAIRLGKPTAYRAVANANGVNQLAIIVPCHRVINTNGELGGYGAGLEHKKWLLDHEKQYVK